MNVIQVTSLENLVQLAEACDVDVLNILHRRANTNAEILWELPGVLEQIPDQEDRVLRNKGMPRESIFHRFVIN